MPRLCLVWFLHPSPSPSSRDPRAHGLGWSPSLPLPLGSLSLPLSLSPSDCFPSALPVPPAAPTTRKRGFGDNSPPPLLPALPPSPLLLPLLLATFIMAAGSMRAAAESIFKAGVAAVDPVRLVHRHLVVVRARFFASCTPRTTDNPVHPNPTDSARATCCGCTTANGRHL